jgi:photosystem II stability/assembly factor-like uncharacterized protein
MAKTLLVFACSLVFSPVVRADEHSRSRDVTPDPATVFSNFSEFFAFHGEDSLLVSAGRSGFHRSDDRGDRWRRAMNGFVARNGVEPFARGFCQAPSEPSTVYSPSLVTNSRGFAVTSPPAPIFRTGDLGRSWRTAGSIDGHAYDDCAVDPSNPEVVYVLSEDDASIGSLFKSVDGGRTFSVTGLPPIQGPTFVRISPNRPQTVYVGNATGDPADGVYVSNDGGVTFARLPASPPEPFWLFAHPSRENLLFVIDGRALVLHRSDDGGTTFQKVGPGEVNGVAFDREVASTVYLAAGANRLHRSNDFGATFTRLAGPAPAQVGPAGVRAVGVAPADEGRARLYIGTDRGPYRSDDGGNTFKSISKSYRGGAVNDLAIDANGRLMVAVYFTVVAFRARTPGHPRSDSYDLLGANITTTQVNLQLRDWLGTAIAASPVDANTAIVSTVISGLFRTTDGGATWEKAAIAPSAVGGTVVRATFARSNSSRVYLVARGPGLFRSDDGGKSFKRMFGERLGAVAVDPGNADVVYLAAYDNGHGLFKSVNGGATVVGLGQPGNFSSLAIDPRHPQTIYAGNRDGGVLRSLNGGATWSSASAGLPPTGDTLAVAVDPQIPARVYAWVKTGGLFVSADGGLSWTAADTGEALRRSGVNVGRASMAVDPLVPGRVYLGNSGVVQIDTLAEDTESAGEDD